jgi:hypothetical protein
MTNQTVNQAVADLAHRVNRSNLERSGSMPDHPCKECGGTLYIQKPYANGCGFYSRRCRACKGTGRRR